jgi:hypothetical protein
MKKKLFITALIALVFIACKKSDSSSSTVGSTPKTTGSTKSVTATINGVSFVSDPNGFLIPTLDMTGNTYVIMSLSNSKNYPKPMLTFRLPKSKILKGSFPITYDFSNIMAIYTENGADHAAVNGNLNITELDTMNLSITKFTATFDFNTDTILGKYFSVTNGSFKY